MKINEAKEKILDEVIKYAAEEAAKEMAEEMTEPEHVEFSERHNKRMEALFKKYRRKKKKAVYVKRTAIIVAAFVAVMGISVMSVQAWRVRLMNFVMNITDTNTEIRYVESDEKEDTYQTEDVKLGYIPEGFKLTGNSSKGEKLYLNFQKDEQLFSLIVRKGNSVINADSENAESKKVRIGNKEIFLTDKDGKYTLNWIQNEKSYTLAGNLSKEQMIKIAEKIE